MQFDSSLLTPHSSLIRVGILGAAGYTGGELIRVLVNHPQATIVFANSESHAGDDVTSVHEGLYGDTDLKFTSDLPFDKVDVVFFCFGHGKSEAFMKEHDIPERVKVIDLAQDFRLAPKEMVHTQHPTPEAHDFVYGLPEINRSKIASAMHVANPGCFATCIQLGLLPAAKLGLIKHDVSVKAFKHQHIPEIRQSLTQVQGTLDASIDFIPYRGDFPRGIFATEVVKTEADLDTIVAGYKAFYQDQPFTHYVDKALDLKQVVNTNKALVHCDKVDDKLL